MPWSIFSDGGGQGAAVTWARALLAKIGAPQTPGDQQFVYDWEVSEGGGGKFNPLNEGPVPGDPGLTSTGPQFGGGAADFVSWAAGIQGAADYLGMPNFVRIADDLRRNDPVQARSDLIASPWASSHYAGGRGFSSQALPGHASALGGPGAAGAAAGGGGGGGGGLLGSLPGIGPALTAFADLPQTLLAIAIKGPLVLAGGALMVWGAARATGTTTRIKQAAAAAPAAAGAAL